MESLAEYQRTRSNKCEPVAERYRAMAEALLSTSSPNDGPAQHVAEADPAAPQSDEQTTSANNQEPEAGQVAEESESTAG
ncbi:hypothetical protein PENSPDRAFT_690271 [Peniophora sp. CONT]|nr:hypothetical protein PENSPDRAFT_690271 [Peniophora sp. CONT]